MTWVAWASVLACPWSSPRNQNTGKQVCRCHPEVNKRSIALAPQIHRRRKPREARAAVGELEAHVHDRLLVSIQRRVVVHLCETADSHHDRSVRPRQPPVRQVSFHRAGEAVFGQEFSRLLRRILIRITLDNRIIQAALAIGAIGEKRGGRARIVERWLRAWRPRGGGN